MVEQHVFARLDADGRIQSMSLLCSGFQVEPNEVEAESHLAADEVDGALHAWGEFDRADPFEADCPPLAGLRTCWRPSQSAHWRPRPRPARLGRSSSGSAEPLRLDGEDIEIVTVMKERSWRS